MFICAIISRGGKNIPSGMNINKNNSMTVEVLRQLMAEEEPIDTIVIANNNNGALIKPVITWNQISSQLRRLVFLVFLVFFFLK